MSESAEKQLAEVLDGFSVGMLVTQTQHGELRSRPMALARRDGTDAVYFATDFETGKMEELEAHPRVNIAMQSDSRYLSLSGRAEVVRDRQIIEDAWSPAMKPWFPEGKDDPSLVLIKVELDTGEYWDQSGTNMLRFLYQAGKAVFNNEQFSSDSEALHAKVDL